VQRLTVAVCFCAVLASLFAVACHVNMLLRRCSWLKRFTLALLHLVFNMWLGLHDGTEMFDKCACASCCVLY
jgi:hypothetical protein